MKKAQTHERLLSSSILDEQIKLETHTIREGAKRYRRMAQSAIKRGAGANLKPAERMLLHWLQPLVDAVSDEKRSIRKKEKADGRSSYGPVLLALDSWRIGVITMHEVIGACMDAPGGVLVQKIAYRIGRAVTAEINYDIAKRKGKKTFAEMNQCIRHLNPQEINRWANANMDDSVWERKVCMHIGIRLMWHLIGVASAASYDQEFKLAFHYENRWEGKKEKRFLRMDDDVFNIIEKGHHLREFMRPRYLPMVVPPYPWQADCEGGYVRVRTPYMSHPKPVQKEAVANNDTAAVDQCLNAVNSQSWRVNKLTLDVAEQIWDTGGGMADIPLLENLPKPVAPMGGGDEQIARYKSDASKVRIENEKRHVDRINFNHKMAVADRMKGYDAIWLPHQLDFRGRAYPIPLHLHPQGDDICRGLLEFSEAKPIAPQSRRWLKIHIANTFGFDKWTYAERIKWADQHQEDFTKYATDPINNDGWTEAEDPWQALQACYAMASDKVAQRLPIHVDGTCNGLQHYSALGRDLDGGRAVNLVPVDTPADVYAAVAGIVEQIIAQDADSGYDIAQMLAGNINRKLIKRPVMTSVYGVTLVGARQQIYDEIETAGIEGEHKYPASMYLGRTVLKAMNNVCHGAADIMKWLTTCAKIITKECDTEIQWTTPLGLPVVQPYRRWNTIRIKTVLQEVSTQVYGKNAPLSKKEQILAFPPNFIHSIDSSHMLMTAKACCDEGISFGSVHDSYWTHAATMDRMNIILREQFIKLHEQDILNDLKNQFAKRYQVEFPDPPERGELDIAQVKNSQYFFS